MGIISLDPDPDPSPVKIDPRVAEHQRLNLIAENRELRAKIRDLDVIIREALNAIIRRTK